MSSTPATVAPVEVPGTSIFRRFQGVDLEVVRAKGSATDRIVKGIAVPWDVETNVDGWTIESFRKGAVDHQMKPAGLQRIKFSKEHMYLGGAAVGITKLLRNDAKGLYGEWYVSETPDGDAALTYAEDMVMDQLSVGFRTRADGNEWPVDPATGRPGRKVIRTKVDLFEVALVPEGAYGDGAVVTGFRSAQPGETREQHLRALLAQWGAEPWQIDAGVQAIMNRQQADADQEALTQLLASTPTLDQLLAGLQVAS